MVNQQELNRIDIRQWADLEGDFVNSNLLLGNGFSLNFADSFRYGSLFKKFIEKCPRPYAEIFKGFDTNNFENILQQLSYAISVNKLFNIQVPEMIESTNVLKNGLITTIRDIHPKSETIFWERLVKVADKMTLFVTIFTLNYDLFLYHILMILKDRREKNERENLSSIEWPYTDCFWGDYDKRFKSYMYHNPNSYRAVFYLHGALFIFKSAYLVDEIKLIRGDRSIQLIELVGNIISEGIMPVFVCEGDSSVKFKQIRSSHYLKDAFVQLDRAKENKFVIFGCSLTEQDDHIVNALDKSGRKLAISLHLGEKSLDELRKVKQYYMDRFTKAEVLFFDSASLFGL